MCSSSLENVFKSCVLNRIQSLEFIASRKWNELEYIRDSGNVNGYNNSELL